MEGSEIIEPEEWHHLVFRFDAQSKCFFLVNYNCMVGSSGVVGAFSYYHGLMTRAV